MKFFIMLGVALWPFLGLSQSLSPDRVDALQKSLDFWEVYGDRCEGFPSKLEEDGRCDDGDAVLFNGLLCLSGYEPGCESVRLSQDENGQWWRSPKQRLGNTRDDNSFSRDMATGALLYLLVTGDKEAADRWFAWMRSMRQPLKIKGITIANISRLCHDETDFTCAVTPGIWENIGRVWSAIDLPQHEVMSKPYSEYGSLGKGLSAILALIDVDWNDVARLEVKSVKPGYRMHLKGVLALIAKRINERAQQSIHDWEPLARDLNRLQPQNLFFRYLAQGASDQLVDNLLQVCPHEGTEAPKRQWAWERADSSEAWKESMGWDCFFLGRLLLQP